MNLCFEGGTHVIFQFIHYDKLLMKHNLIRNPDNIKEFTLNFLQIYIKTNRHEKKISL